MTSYQLWERIFPQEKRWLGLICGLSLAIHVAVFFVFRIERLPESRAVEKPPRIVFISADTFASRLDGSNPMKWVDWRDPTAIALPRAPIPDPVPEKNSKTSAYRSPTLPELPEWTPLEVSRPEVGEELQQMVASSMNTQRTTAMPLTVEAPPKLSGTVVVLGGALKGREVTKRLQMPRPQTKVSLRATEYYARVLPSGTVVQVKVERSCGNTTIDQQGLNILKQWRFGSIKSESEAVWGIISVFWDFQEENPDRMEIQF